MALQPTCHPLKLRRIGPEGITSGGVGAGTDPITCYRRGKEEAESRTYLKPEVAAVMTRSNDEYSTPWRSVRRVPVSWWGRTSPMTGRTRITGRGRLTRCLRRVNLADSGAPC